MLNVETIKKDFPIFLRRVEDKDLIYLDSAATSQKPYAVIDAISDYYKNHNANIHRGIYTLSEEATEMYNMARSKVAGFIGADADEIVFTKGTTESLNMVAFEWALENLGKDDLILTTVSEHHSNLVPWRVVANMVGAKVVYAKITEDGELDIKDFEKKLKEGVKLVAISHASNVLGSIFPVKRICEMAKKVGARVSVDGAQAVPHMKINVKDLGCDFYSFSAHKMIGPMGVGVLWGKKELLEKMEPYEYGGGMVSSVKEGEFSWAGIPEKFEAGTPNVAGVVGFAAAIDYLESVGMENIYEHEKNILKYAIRKLSDVKGLKILGPKDVNKRTGLVSFVVDGIHPHDIAAVLSSRGVAVRAGQHCAMPLHNKLGIPASTRASFYLYNTKREVDELVNGIKEAIKILG